MRTTPTVWLITGVTGFLGKVVLADLIRRREELGVAELRVLVRSRGSKRAEARFRETVAASPCFAGLPANWQRLVTVLDGDLTDAALGLPDPARALEGVTHIVHSAATIEFDLPAAEAARTNIDAALHLLAQAERIATLRRFVYVSTAYVTPHPGNEAAIPEALVTLPAPAEELVYALRSGLVTDEQLLARTGHPNTYTLTKCLAEHLVLARRGRVPVSIVRPSIISAARQHPFPGWIDSTAGFGAFVTLIGLGHLRAVVGDPAAKLDVVPVDDVSARIISAAFDDSAEPTIRHAAAGLAAASTVAQCWETITEWFTLHPLQRRPHRGFLGVSRLRYRIAELWHHRLPLAVGALRSSTARRRVGKLATRLEYLNRIFPYFTTRSFNFRVSQPIPAQKLGTSYVRTICRGLYRHVLRADDREWMLGGAMHRGWDGDLRWALAQPKGNLWVRMACWIVAKVLRRISDRVTVDLPSFERARRALPADAALVIVPSHRSYLDFVLVSYLAFARPDLGIPIPHIAATMEFGRIPLLGRILSALHAFYLRRGTGKEDPELTRRVRTLINDGKCLEFFIEGARSRTREFLPPKRGLLRCLQSTGHRVAILPIGLSYDRIPEEQAFAAELNGAAKPPMRLFSLLRWSRAAFKGKVVLGRMHIAAGAPVVMSASDDVHEIADRVVDELRGAMAVSTYHLAQYCSAHPLPRHDAASLRRLIEAKGGRVLESALPVDATMDPRIAATLREHFADACAEAFGQMPSSRSLAANVVRLGMSSRL